MIRSRPDNFIRNGLFLGLLVIPGIVMLFATRQDVSQREARTLASRPANVELSRRPLEYTSLWDAYLKDHFGLRERLLDVNALIRRTLEAPTSGNVIVGKQGWLYFDQGLLPTGESRAEIEQKVARQVELIEVIARRLEKQGTPLFVVPTPDKHTLYPEHLPDWLEGKSNTHVTDQLIAGVRSKNIAVIDVKELLAPSKDQYPLFFLTDTHWTPIAAALAFNEIARVSRGTLMPVPISPGAHLVAGAPPDLSRMAGFDGRPLDWSIPGFVSSYPGAVREELQVADGSQQKPFVMRREGPGSRVLIVGDSFSAHWTSFALESANTVYWSHHNQCLADWSTLLSLKVDLVIYQMVGRTIGCPALGPEVFERIQELPVLPDEIFSNRKN